MIKFIFAVLFFNFVVTKHFTKLDVTKTGTILNLRYKVQIVFVLAILYYEQLLTVKTC